MCVGSRHVSGRLAAWLCRQAGGRASGCWRWPGPCMSTPHPLHTPAQEGEAAGAGEQAAATGGEGAGEAAEPGAPEFEAGCVLHFDFGEDADTAAVQFLALKDSFGGRDGGVAFVDYKQVRAAAVWRRERADFVCVCRGGGSVCLCVARACLQRCTAPGCWEASAGPAPGGNSRSNAAPLPTSALFPCSRRATRRGTCASMARSRRQRPLASWRRAATWCPASRPRCARWRGRRCVGREGAAVRGRPPQLQRAAAASAAAVTSMEGGRGGGRSCKQPS